ncbi:MAG: glycosyltransferase [Bacillota bacterium]|nr:glycosyltransferase [Bacillota bacterium]HOB92091.1 glycosyltransferase [Bacillota bacterium]HPZ54524.1 glycosyltransferase [Bacillota bacterium]HQD18773.1 glycosyltransferase [Bacillota bacterium]
MQLDVSVVIPTYNRASILKHCLQSFANQTYPKDRFELVVVDDCSSDNTVEVVDKFRDSSGIRTVYIRNDRRMDITYTRNRGIWAASGRVIIQTDSDFIVTPEFIEGHMEAHREPNVMCTGPVIHITSLDQLFVKKPTIRDMCKHPLPGCNGSVERQVLVDSGGYDEDLCEYGWEDLELATRLRAKGIKSVRSDKAAGYHLDRVFKIEDLPSIVAREEARARMAVVYEQKWPTFGVRMSTWLSPVFFALDRILFAFDWIHSPAVVRLMERWIKSGKRNRAEVLAQLYANHAYVKGLRKALRRRSRDSGSEVRK